MDVKAPADAKRARWDRLTPQEKDEFKKRFERLKRMSPEERAQLKARAGKLTHEIAEIEASLSDEDRTSLSKLAPRERRKALRGLVTDRAKSAASRWLRRMTPAERQRVENAQPADRARMMRAIRERELAGLPDRIATLGQEMGLSKAELRRVGSGTPAEQRQAIVALVRANAIKYVGKVGLPKSLDQQRWNEIQRLEDSTFLRAVHRIRRRDPEFGIHPKHWEHRAKRREALAERLEAFAVPVKRERARAGGRSDKAQRRRVLLSRRTRAEELIIQRARLSQEVGTQLRALNDEEFLVAYRVTVKALRDGGSVSHALGRWFGRRGKKD